MVTFYAQTLLDQCEPLIPHPHPPSAFPSFSLSSLPLLHHLSLSLPFPASLSLLNFPPLPFSLIIPNQSGLCHSLRCCTYGTLPRRPPCLSAPEPCTDAPSPPGGRWPQTTEGRGGKREGKRWNLLTLLHSWEHTYMSNRRMHTDTLSTKTYAPTHLALHPLTHPHTPTHNVAYLKNLVKGCHVPLPHSQLVDHSPQVSRHWR